MLELRSHQRVTWLPALVLALTAALLAVPAVGADFDQGMLWRVERSGKVSYLFGTMHSDDPRVVDVPAPVQSTFAAADRLVMEVELNAQSVTALAGAMFFTDGRSLSDVLGPGDYQRAVAAMVEHGYPETIVASMRPWAVMATLSVPRPRTGRFLDLVLSEQAQQQGKPVVGLETPQEQIAVFADLSDADQKLLLLDTLRQLDSLESQFEELLQLYLRRDLGGLLEFQRESMADSDPRVATLFEGRAIVDRNRRMARRIGPQLDVGNSFIAVGALHLPGEQGLLQLLRREGYGISRVY